MKTEYCIKCDQPTGRAGTADDSIHLDDGTGPLCEECYAAARKPEGWDDSSRVRVPADGTEYFRRLADKAKENR